MIEQKFRFSSTFGNSARLMLIWLLLLSMLVLQSCGKQFYVKRDYTFYDPQFIIPDSAVLRTDYVYVLDSIYSQGDTQHPKTFPHTFYKFYKNGQCNLVLDPDHKIVTPGEYAAALNRANSTAKTLFQGYYKVKGNRFIIQNKVLPNRTFSYKYGYFENHKLVIVKVTPDGHGKFEDRYFTTYYKEFYRYVPLDPTKFKEASPNW